jgi:ABC-type phosphate transport system permease subunit
VIGNTVGVHANLFLPSDTLASKIANTYQGAPTELTSASLAYFAVILFVLSLIFNTVARLLVRNVGNRAARAG